MSLFQIRAVQKVRLWKQLEPLIEQGITFIGGHPMTGSHKSGVSAAREHLFENAYYILTPSKNVKEEQIDKMRDLLIPTKGKVVVLDAVEHDRMTAIVSHFPHLSRLFPCWKTICPARTATICT